MLGHLVRRKKGGNRAQLRADFLGETASNISGSFFHVAEKEVQIEAAPSAF